MSSFANICHFIFELSLLKKLPRSGSFLAGIRNGDTVGEHVFRATQIAFLLAEMEGANAEHAAFLASIHDNGEIRVGDCNKVMARYISMKTAEKTAFLEQIQNLPEGVQKKYQSAFLEMEEKKTKEAICAKDADLLEMAFQAKEFLEQGFLGMQNWLDNISTALSTKTAEKIFAEMNTISSNDWWKNLKKLG